MKLNKKIYAFIVGILLICFSTISFATVELKDGDKRLDIIMQFSDWQNANSDTVSIADGVGIDKATKKLIELCNQDLDTLNSLNDTFTYNGFDIWRAGAGQNESTNFLNTVIENAIKEVKSGTQNEERTETDKEKRENEIIAIVSAKSFNKMSLEELKNIDRLLKEYDTLYHIGQYHKFYPYLDACNNAMKNYGETSSAYNQYNENNQSIRNEENDTSKQHGVLGNSTPNGGHSIDEMINESQSFINAGKDSNRGTISTNQLQAGSNTLYNILLSIGVFLAVAVGMYLAIKFMLSSVDDKAKVKEALVPYIAGCVVIFGAFVIWKLAITLLSGIA